MTRIDTRTRILDAAQTLVLERGFTGTSVDAVLAATGLSKGAFFHHFPSKTALGAALVDRYARADAELLDQFLAAAERASADPAGQLIEFLGAFEDAVDELSINQPGCLFVSFVYEQSSDDGRVLEIVADSIRLWRKRLLAKLEEAQAVHGLALPVDLESLADQVFTVFEGGFILARAMQDPTRLRAQLAHLRTYITLLFNVAPGEPARVRRNRGDGLLQRR